MKLAHLNNDAAMLWRARQLTTAGYTPFEIVGWIGCPMDVANEAAREMQS
jgi:hypothetical protein